MKLCSFNTLYYAYSNGNSSYRDQLHAAQNMFITEQPDVGVLLEMPNPRQSATGDNISMLQHLQGFELWLRKAGYEHQRKIDNIISVWVVSKKPLVPLLLLGADTIGGAAGRIFKIPPTEFYSKKVEAHSDFLDCIAALTSPHERSVICGVVDDDCGEMYCPSSSSSSSTDQHDTTQRPQKTRRVLPLIATHARCLFQNTRFGKLIATLMRGSVCRKGLVVGDMNFDVHDDKLQHLDKDDERLMQELMPGILDKFAQLPQAPVPKKPSDASCHCITYPFGPLNIDGIFCATPIDFKVGFPSAIADTIDNTVCPCEEFPSDHKWISCTVPKEAMITVPVREIYGSVTKSLLGGHDVFVDARNVCYLWSQSHKELFGLLEQPVQVQRPPGAAAPSPPEGGPPGPFLPGGGGGGGGGDGRPRTPQGPPRNRSPPKSFGAPPPSAAAPNTQQQQPVVVPTYPASGGAAAATSTTTTNPNDISASELLLLGNASPPLCPLDVKGECPGVPPCTYQHRACNFGRNCRKGGCQFGHPRGRERNLTSRDSTPMATTGGYHQQDSSAPPAMGARAGTQRPN